MRRRRHEGTVHPVYSQGRLTGWRGLASYQEPDTGQRRRRSVTRPTRAEAERALHALIRSLPKQSSRTPRTAVTATLSPAPADDTLHALFVRWITFKRRDVRPATSREYVRVLNGLLPEVGIRRLAELTVLDVDRVVQHLTASHGARAAGRALRILRMVLRQAVRWQLVSMNVAEHIRAPRTEKTEMLVWTPAEVRRFLDAAAAHRLFPLFVLAVSTGLRKGELLGLHWGDVNLDARELTVQHNLVVNDAGQYVVGQPKTDAGRRRIALADDTVAALRAHWRAEHRGARAPLPSGFVFTAASGHHVQPRQLDKVYRALTTAAGLPRIRFHDLRHTAASLLIRQGIPAKVVADRLGHADPTFTLKVYTHVYDDQRVQAALPLDRLLGGQGPGSASPSPLDLERGLDALTRLHAALGAFLEEAPEWAREIVRQQGGR